MINLRLDIDISMQVFCTLLMFLMQFFNALQHIYVILGAVSYPNYTIRGQGLVHILSPINS